MPRLALTQINVVGSPEADRRVQGMQDQLVHVAMDVQKLKVQFRTEAEAFCEGRAQDRQIYQEAFMVAERFYEQRAHQFAENCKRFLQEELEQLSRKQVQEDATYRRLRQHEIQRAHEFEMRASAARNQEASVSQERYAAQKEVFQLSNQRDAAVAEAHRVANEWSCTNNAMSN